MERMLAMQNLVHPAPKRLVTWKRPVLGTYSARLERPRELDTAP
jgi:hypothetical protein